MDFAQSQRKPTACVVSAYAEAAPASLHAQHMPKWRPAGALGDAHCVRFSEGEVIYSPHDPLLPCGVRLVIKDRIRARGDRVTGPSISKVRVLREGTRVIFEFECGDAYRAEVFREDIVEKTKDGHFRMSLKVKSVKEESLRGASS